MKEDSLSYKAYFEIRRKILSNQLLPGMRLKEDYWAKKLNMSRMSVREALNRLLGEKLLNIGEKGGFFIKSITAEDIKEIRELREVLELGALRILLNKLSKEKIEELELICDDFTSMVQRGYYDGACEADIKFHESLINFTENEKLKEIYHISNIPLFHQKIGKAQSRMEDYELTDMEHHQILKGLKKKDFKLVEDTFIKHLIRGEMAVLDSELTLSQAG
jgi:DNA-binding GntR family transcriptional regulator